LAGQGTGFYHPLMTPGEAPEPSKDPASQTPLPEFAKPASAARVGGALGVAGCCVGMLLFLAACAGFEAALVLSLIPLILGLVGLVLVLISHFRRAQDTHESDVVFALFVCFLAAVGGLLEVALWRGWPILFGMQG